MRERREPAERTDWRALLWLRRHRIKGRDWFVWNVGVLRFGVPAALLATAIRAATEPFVLRHFLLHLAANCAAGVLGGYVAGRIIWNLLINRK